MKKVSKWLFLFDLPRAIFLDLSWIYGYIIYRKLREILISKKDNENENDVFELNE